MNVSPENEDDDLTLLRRWAEERSEEAFRTLEMPDEESLIRHGGLSSFTQALTKQTTDAAARWLVSLPELSKVRQWAGSHFQNITGPGTEDYLNSSFK